MKKGFSLLEMIIVVAIIAIMATIGIGSYRSAKRGILIDLETDSLVADFSRGRTIAREKPRCVIIVIEKNKAPVMEEQSYDSAKKNCVTEAAVARKIQWTEELSIQGITLDENTEANFLRMTFTPPQGVLILSSGESRFSPRAMRAWLKIGFTGGFPQQREISINSTIGTFEKTKK